MWIDAAGLRVKGSNGVESNTRSLIALEEAHCFNPGKQMHKCRHDLRLELGSSQMFLFVKVEESYFLSDELVLQPNSETIS